MKNTRKIFFVEIISYFYNSWYFYMFVYLFVSLPRVLQDFWILSSSMRSTLFMLITDKKVFCIYFIQSEIEFHLQVQKMFLNRCDPLFLKTPWWKMHKQITVEYVGSDFRLIRICLFLTRLTREQHKRCLLNESWSFQKQRQGPSL